MRIEPLTAQHDVSEFDCGEESLNNYIRFALQAKKKSLAATFVLLNDNDEIVGYYARVMNSVSAESVGKPNLTRRPIPVMLLAQFAIVKEWQRKGLGKMMMKHLFERVLQFEDEGDACFAVMLDALNEGVKKYYVDEYSFKECVDKPSRLYLLTKTIKKAAGRN